MKKKFVTIFPLTTNIHLTKDVGMIPFLFHKLYGYDSYIVSYFCTKKTYKRRGLEELFPIIDSSYSYLDNEVKGLKIKFIKDFGRFFFLEISVLFYLFRRAKQIDILNLYHHSGASILLGILYKMLNKKGKLYIKGDVNTLNLSNEFSRPKGIFSNFIWNIYIKKLDVFSAETLRGVDIFKKIIPSEKVICIPNGCYYENDVNILNFAKKDNIIISVGRHGSTQKNTEILFNALEKINLDNWKLILIGSIENNFEKFISNFLNDNPTKKGQIIITGNINNKIELQNYYNHAKVFCLTSRWEGFPLIFPEALFFGNYIISTKIDAAYDITKNGEIGTLVDFGSSEQITDTIKAIIKDQSIIEKKYDDILEHSKHYTWINIIKILKNSLIT